MNDDALEGMTQLVSLQCNLYSGPCLRDMTSLTSLEIESLGKGTESLRLLTQLRLLKFQAGYNDPGLCLTRMQSLTSLDCYVRTPKVFCRSVLPYLTQLRKLKITWASGTRYVLPVAALLPLVHLKELDICGNTLNLSSWPASLTLSSSPHGLRHFLLLTALTALSVMTVGWKVCV